MHAFSSSSVGRVWTLTLFLSVVPLLSPALAAGACECDNAEGPSMWSADTRFKYETISCKGDVMVTQNTISSVLVGQTVVNCSVATLNVPILQTMTYGVSGTVSASGTLSISNTVSAEVAAAAIGKIGASTTASASVTVGASGSFSETESVTDGCTWVVPPQHEGTCKVHQKTTQFATSQTFTTCTKATVTASPSNPGSVGSSVIYSSSVKTATVTVTGTANKEKACSDTLVKCQPSGQDPEVDEGDAGVGPDSDEDGILDDEEAASGSNPDNKDSDGDGADDGIDPDDNDSDSDDDGIPDGGETHGTGTDPLDDDTDHDGTPDIWDVFPLDNPDPFINLLEPLPGGNALALGSGIELTGILSPAPPVLVLRIGDLLSFTAPNADGSFSFPNVPVQPGGQLFTLSTVSAFGDSDHEQLIDTFGVHVQPGPWDDLGSGLAGVDGTPLLVVAGDLLGNDPVTMTVAKAAPNSLAGLVLGVGLLNLPFKGGTLLPTPDVVLFGFPTGPNGTLQLVDNWPPGLPPGLPFFSQFWIQDPAGPHGFSASNGVQGTTP
ncbi:MAG: hypothetical protein DRQ55_14300 [Planctomycetota bacterium]|nr:MAG: hypothetical protein DRQ55_14300 [Planctomycetota bacterium]